MNSDILRVSCRCGACDELGATAFVESDWEFFGDADVLGGDDHFAYCPVCSTARQATFEQDDATETVLSASLGRSVLPPEFTAGGDVETLSERLGRTTADGTPALGFCTSCETLILATHRHEGPTCPEVGWTYYECPECGTVMTPSVVADSI